VKGIAHVPAHNTPITPSRRDALLMAIARARRWADELDHGRLGSFRSPISASQKNLPKLCMRGVRMFSYIDVPVEQESLMENAADKPGLFAAR
jgi:hypothetical protein